MSKPAVVKFDMSQSSIVKPKSTEFRELITSVYQSVVGLKNPSPDQGDGATIVFNSAFQAESFAEQLHKQSFLDHNATARKESDCWSFRVGIATGDIYRADDKKWTGDGLVTAARLEEALKKDGTGEILIDAKTLAALPPERQVEYGELEKIEGKSHEKRPYEAHRRRVVPPAPWDQRWNEVTPELKWEFNVALGALESAKPILHSIFAKGVLRNSDTKRLLGERKDLAPVSRIQPQIWDHLKSSLKRSAFNCLDVLDPSASINNFAESDPPYVWLVHLDGSRNVAHGFPFFATTLALVDAKSEEALVGLTYLPWSGESFFAIRGGGAYHNSWADSSRLKVSNRSLARSIVYVEFPTTDRLRHNANTTKAFSRECELVAQLFSKTHRTRGLASASFALAYVAKGVFDAYVDFSHTTPLATIAAGVLLVKEAKGEVVLRPENRDFRQCTAGSPAAMRELCPLLGLVRRVR